MFEGFATTRIATTGNPDGIFLRHGGSGPPLLLLHGNPQTHACWHLVAPLLAPHFSLVIPDLRGYGDSGKPEPGPRGEGYDKRVMARDMVEVMAALGHVRFAVAAHDRGARVAHRLALDHPDAVTRLCVMDIVPTLYRYENLNAKNVLGAWHWFFLAQPNGVPERMVGADPDFFLKTCLDGWLMPGSSVAPEALAEYRRCLRDPLVIRAMCADYRAGAGLDLEQDRASRDAGQRVTCPLHVLWGAGSHQGSGYDLLSVWRDWASGPLSGRGLASGHFVAEEQPAEVAAELRRFLDDRA